MGARGNSGVILSQILRGPRRRRSRAPPGWTRRRARRRPGRAADGAYQAVQQPGRGHHPDRGTGRRRRRPRELAGGRPGRRARGGPAGAAEALARTPELLPVLKAAGVVDSGGAGLPAAPRRLPPCRRRPAPAGPPATGAPVRGQVDRRPAEDRPGRGASAGRAALRGHVPPRGARRVHPAVPRGVGRDWATRSWSSAGTACGTATSTPTTSAPPSRPRSKPAGPAASGCPTCGRRSRRSAGSARPSLTARRAGARGRPVRCAVVAVCTGEGIRRIFRSLGVHHVVSGGQSMNPSTAELLAAIEAAPAERWSLLPNNNNIVAGRRAGRPAVRQAGPGRAHPRHPGGLRRPARVRPRGDADANAAPCRQAPPRVVAGEVTQAVRASVLRRRADRRGRLSRVCPATASRSVAPTSPRPPPAARAPDRRRPPRDRDRSSPARAPTPADTRRITEWLDEHHPGVGIEVHQGGQPLYPYLF